MRIFRCPEILIYEGVRLLSCPCCGSLNIEKIRNSKLDEIFNEIIGECDGN